MKGKLLLIVLIMSIMANLNAQDKKTFAPSDKVTTERVTFKNRFGITLVADMYRPVNAEGLLPALAVSGSQERVGENRVMWHRRT